MNASGSIARRDPESELLVFDFMGNPPGDPYPFYRKLREKAPALITSDGNMMVLSRHADCVVALRNRAFGKGEEWIQARNVGGEEIRPVMERLQKTMILTNPPEHTRLRRVISSRLTSRN
jgi:cytochrome P450